MQQGDFLNLQVGQGDWRDYLTKVFDDGSSEQWSVNNGRHLEMWFETRWFTVRYEVMRPTREQRVWLYFQHQDSDGLELNRSTMRFRWATP
jgi:hypothetical protein